MTFICPLQAFHPSYGDRVKDQLEIIRHAEEIDKNDDGPPSPPSPPRRRAKTAKAGRYQDESRTPNPPKQAPPPQKRAKTALSDLSDSDSDSEMESPARSVQGYGLLQNFVNFLTILSS